MTCSLLACTDALPEKSTSENDPFASLPNSPPAEGRCGGWRRSLAQGRHVSEVEACLREKALADRPRAIEEAKVMADWSVLEKGDSELKALIMALAKYPEPGSLERYLVSRSLLPNEPDQYNRLDRALTAADYLRERGNIHWFDVETGMFPNYHDDLLADIAELSDFGEVAFSEIPPSNFDADEEPYLLKALVAGKAYQQEAENYGDWYDLGAVLKLMNRIALDQDLESRFVTLATGDQTAIVWVVDDRELTLLVDEGLVTLGADELAMQNGKAFEAEVRSSFAPESALIE